MCNLYSQTKSQDAMRHVFDDVLEDDEELIDTSGNLPATPGIWPDHPAPIIRHLAGGNGASGFRLSLARWGMPTPPQFLAGRRTDPGVTNIRNLASPHWQRWFGVPHRCLVPFTSFAEPDSRSGPMKGKPIWFALGPDRPLAFFAGICTEWTSIRKLKEGEVTVDAFAFLTCDPNREVASIHPKAMPVILTRPEEWRQWLTTPFDRARHLQRPLPDGELQIVAEGAPEDAA
ncbi:SOS response-associated peptidase [Gemmobacter lutimaris]|uniref:Abasic site processing protein n=1 Tax=Gemmobacter lutimaris TaxID=2306023 RepID=A0A398BPQ4_9RHOB|nr:SOS response-associated peptidase family protein [Gemmobacter lutimaris]RID89820.1 SOS response-associated peptidase [Gemmobacter lutimaris]